MRHNSVDYLHSKNPIKGVFHLENIKKMSEVWKYEILRLSHT